MAMFGKSWAEIGAGLKDIGIGLQGGQSDYLGGYREDQRALQARNARTAAAKALADKLLARSRPQATASQRNAIGPDVGGEQQVMMPPIATQEDALSLEALLPDLLTAQSAGVDISPYAALLKSRPTEEVINAGNGAIGIYKPGQGVTFTQAPNPNSNLEQSLLRAQIAAVEAQAKQREQQGSYYGAKARQPYAPPRASGSSSNKHPPLPAGFRIVQ